MTEKGSVWGSPGNCMGEFNCVLVLEALRSDRNFVWQKGPFVRRNIFWKTRTQGFTENQPFLCIWMTWCSRGCPTNSVVVKWLINLLSHPLPKQPLKCRHALTVRARLKLKQKFTIDKYIINLKQLKIGWLVQKLQPCKVEFAWWWTYHTEGLSSKELLHLVSFFFLLIARAWTYKLLLRKWVI